MKNLSYLLVLLFLFGCGKKESDPVWDWGYLPSSEISSSKREQCAHEYYQSFPISTDSGESLRIRQSSISGRTHKHYIGSGCMVATVSTRVYLDADKQANNFYSVSVLMPTLDERCRSSSDVPACKESSVSHTVLFSRHISVNEIGDYFKSKTMNQIVSYDKSSRIVIFKLRDRTLEYAFPAF
ncbi:hypothetical protein PSECIP111951_02666 [Pseudoalteromonas holothuriae]|uniref:Lipoprotein n=1 Tax=Pseudoalteromonas holothuriae TaxID=2963714 RepID=A0ABM9GLN0_9GAMM|nr:hypothetical protein [Pseudoalteromonas sp. CIP111951]CAH9062308.1 hypothetical protein PSECIP111951_02666 [Pseudoalteromonas sp. CIP111951]